MSPARARRLKLARERAGFGSASAAAAAHGWNRNTYASNENGHAPFSFQRAKAYAAAFGIDPAWLYDSVEGPAAVSDLVPVVGQVGAWADGRADLPCARVQAHALRIPGSSPSAAALQVTGHFLHGFADDGSLVYFEYGGSEDTALLLGHVVVAAMGGVIALGRLQRGSSLGYFDLVTVAGAAWRDVHPEWTSRLLAVIPTLHAKAMLRSMDTAVAAFNLGAAAQSSGRGDPAP